MCFLPRHDARDLRDAAPPGIAPESLFLGRGSGAIEVAHFSTQRTPSVSQLKELHERRQGRRPTPVLIVVTHGTNRAAVAARFGDEWSISPDLDRSQVERLSEAALEAPDRHTADSLLRSKLPQLEQPVPGLRNAGLFAMHELEHGVRARSDWQGARQASRLLLSLRGRELVERLGYSIEQTHGPHAVLRARGTRIAVAVFLERSDEIEPANERYDGLSPVSYALAKADAEHLDYVVMAAGTVLRVYPVKPGVGTARRGRTETFVEMDLALLNDEHAAYLSLLASADALLPDGAFTQILETSKRFAADLAAGLRDRVYENVMPELCDGLFRARRLRDPSREKLQETLDMALLTLFRLLFVAYAEDKELLPYNTSETYRDHSLKRIAHRLANETREGAVYGDEDFYWTEVVQLWKAVDKGNPPWRVPAYNGGLFASGEDASVVGRLLGDVTLPDRIFARALGALLLEETAEGVLGPVDFRALGVREFGTIYEGLLEQELSVAEQDLAVDANGAYVPVGGERRRGRRRRAESEDIVVRAGEPYLHDKSGARKASGAYYTKDFAVEHLLERALEPALADHLARLDAIYDDREKADRFFDFHVADIAMGSGHFLVAAVDHLERGLSNYLANKRQLPGVRDELERLRKTALEALGKDWRGEPIEDTQLLRRQIARRCIHGVDLNPLAVELARLSLWIHTFVPGLPLSFLDANLVVGNSLVGIATFEEARELIGVEAQTLFSVTAEEMLANAREPVARLAKLAEATAAEVRDARKLYRKMREEVRGTEDLFTVLSASRVDDEIAQALEQGQVATRLARSDFFSDRILPNAERALGGLRPLHFPTAFPQVFLRDRTGFDVIIGNPPWDKVRFEEDAFFVRYIPGLNALAQAARKRAIAQLLLDRPEFETLRDEERGRAQVLQRCFDARSGAYRMQGSGHLEYAKLFLERILSLLSRSGHMGIVLPRQSLVLGGWAALRRGMFEGAVADVTQWRNKGGWLFDAAEPRYVVALIAVTKGLTSAAASVRIAPGADSQAARRVAETSLPVTWATKTLSSLVSKDLQIPLLTRPGEEQILERLLKHPRVGSRDAGKLFAVPYSVLDVGKDLDGLVAPRGNAFVLRTRNVDQFIAEPDGDCRKVKLPELTRFLREKLVASAIGPMLEADALSEPLTTLELAYRYPARNDDSRTLIAALLPGRSSPAVGYVHSLVAPFGGRRERLTLLGFMNSIVWDWFARRFVDRHVTAPIIRMLPLPSRAASWDPNEVGRKAHRITDLLKHAKDSAAVEEAAALDVMVANALGLSREDMTVVLADFSESGVPNTHRELLLRQLT